MQIRVFDNAEQVARAAAILIAAQITEKPCSVLGLATGSTPVPTYQRLIEMYREGLLDFSKVRSFNLDEYLRLPETHEQSYHRFMRDNLFEHVNILPENTHVPNGNAEDEDAVARDYDRAIEEAGGIDLQLLGIGRNGHIGFNEPADCFLPDCHTVNLTQNTIEANRRFFASEDEVPRQAITLGIGAIMNARKVLLLATGSGKAKAIHDTAYGSITPMCPSSILRTHPNAIILVDREAGALL